MSTTTTTATDTATLRTQLAVRATPEQVWQALTDGALTPGYYFGFEAHYDRLVPGAGYSYTAGGGVMITGEILDVDAGRLLRTTFRGLWDPMIAALPESQVEFTVAPPAMPMPGVTILSCVHENLPVGEASGHLELGWVSILSGLKTLLETGSPLTGAAA